MGHVRLIIFCCLSIHNKCGVPETKKYYWSHFKVQWNLHQLGQNLELIWSGKKQKWFTICDEVFLFKRDVEVCSLADRLPFNNEVYAHAEDILMSRYDKVSNL